MIKTSNALKIQSDLDRKESRIFRRFLNVAMPNLRQPSFSLLSPPAPDVLLKSSGESEQFFELAEIVDSDFAERIRLQFQTTELLSGRFAQESSELRTSYTNAFIWVRFQESASIRKRTKSYDKIIDCLKILPLDFVGRKYFENSTFTEIEILRGNYGAPIIEASPEVGCLSDPLLEIINKKLKKTYSPRTCKPHLLLYYEIQPHCFSLNDFSGVKFWQSKFDCLWIYDDFNQKAYKFS